MESYKYLLFLALILCATKLLGLISKKLQMPQVVGALCAGILLGPSVLNLISMEGENGIILSSMAEIGVILLMFSAGLGTDLRELKKNSIPAMIIAGIGVIVPIAGGFFTYATMFHISYSDRLDLLKSFFIGVILSATSVSITVETLAELGKLNGRVGTTILGAAVIDDILGVIALTVVTSLQDTSVQISTVFIKIISYFIFIGALFMLIRKTRKLWEHLQGQRRTAILSVAFCLILSFVSEEIFGIADITGAYFAGLILCYLDTQPYVSRKVEITSYMIFSPIFFASIGLKTSLSGLTPDIIGFSVVLLIVAILSKVIGCSLGGMMCKFDKKEALQIGIGMISRGEVALIVAQKGYQYGMLDNNLFAPIVLVVIVTTLITPVLLKMIMSEKTAA